jgi:phage shock protein C
MPKKKVAKRKTKKKDEVLDQRVEHFSKEVGALGEKFGKRMEKKGEEWEGWFHRTFGIVGPFISSIFGIIIFSLFIWLVSFVNLLIKSTFLSNVNAFLTGNLGTFFLIFLFFSYTSYFSKTSPRTYKPFSPIVVAIGITIGFWLAAYAIDIANLSLGIAALSGLAFQINLNLHLIFLFFLFLGYLVLAIKVTLEVPKGRAEEMLMRRPERTKIEKSRPGEIRRLYRSGNDRILGGVCGGIAEYLGVDPVIIRLLWIVGTLAAMGFGIIAYIICWIIIPRNPKHKWED